MAAKHDKMHGKVKNLSKKGFGFILRDDGKGDLFFHASDLANCEFDDLRVDSSVTFVIGNGKKGPKAAEVRLV